LKETEAEDACLFVSYTAFQLVSFGVEDVFFHANWPVNWAFSI
jgi:hypothetical protein